MIKIACEPDFLPLTSMMNSPPEGLIIEILELTCARAGLTPNFVSTPLADQMTSLKEGKVDAIAFKAITPGHIRGCDFSTRFFITGAGWFAPAGNPWTIEKVPSARAWRRLGLAHWQRRSAANIRPSKLQKQHPTTLH